jgi:hypothetical protein
MRRGALLLLWYFHMPGISSRNDVVCLWKESLEPLLRTHYEIQAPLNIAITGALLKQLKQEIPDAIEMLVALHKEGILSPLGTFYHEVFPPIIPVRHLRCHLNHDLNLKEEIFGARPVFFYPPNMSWVPSMETLLREEQINAIVLDEGHYRKACQTQTWKWNCSDNMKMETVMLDTMLDEQECQTPFHMSQPNSQDGNAHITAVFRSTRFVKEWTYGNSGILHKPFHRDEYNSRLEVLKETICKGSYITIADDGDRVNPVSLKNYSLFIKDMKDCMDKSYNLMDRTIKTQPIEYLPSFALGDLHDFWYSDFDAIHYSSLLRDLLIAESQGKVKIEDILPVEDVYPLFWKVMARKRWYFDKMLDLLR